MIVIDELADEKLMQRLEYLRANPENSRCIYFNLKNQQGVNSLKEKIIESAAKYIASEDLQIFFCDDGEAFIISQNIPIKEGKAFILDVAAYAGANTSPDFVNFYEVGLHINKLLLVLEGKLEKREKAEEEAKKQRAKLQAERKRNSILSIPTGNSEKIKNRRSARTNLELMIIEDDSFSCRLVENVLQKQYHLTVLNEATYALDTYCRVAPDILFLDINLPDVSGHELLERIISLDPDSYVVMLSGNADKENIMQAMKLGAKGFIAKPFTRDKLFQYIERCPTIKQLALH